MPLRPPYPEIYTRLMTGRLIPFLGAGAPLYTRNPKETPWYKKAQGKESLSYLPNAGELAAYLAVRTEVPESETGELTKMAQYYEAAVGRDPLRERLQEIFSYNQAPTPIHDFLAAAPTPLLIVTTNYDNLMENAFAARPGKPYDVVVQAAKHNTVLWWPYRQANPVEISADDLDIKLNEVSVVYKMHGAVDRRPEQLGDYVITEDDYVELLTRMTRRKVIPPIFGDPFRTRPFLFLGYGLYDWNLRVILNQIQTFRRYPKFRSWAIETLVKPVERKLWEARGVDVYDGLTLEKFLDELKQQAAGGE
jgi:hypothetical protein